MSGAAAAAASERVRSVSERLGELELDVLLVKSDPDVRYLTSYTGDSALLLVAADAAGPAGVHRFLTDFRYETQAAEQVPALFEREIVSGELLEGAAAALASASGRLGFDEALLSIKEHGRLAELLGSAWELVAADGVLTRLRMVKDAGELAHMRVAAQLADEALGGLLEAGLAGRTERDVAIELELRMRRLGAEPSFATIVAAGAHGALPHAQPRPVEIPRDVLVTIDWGALYEGYCSDCTRTYATGEGIGARARELYELVLEAQRTGLEALRPGVGGREVDAAARAVIEQAGEGERFGHGLGHGVGMQVHEAPRLSRTAPEEPLQAGNVVTVEPGVYLPGQLGVRIEDLVALGERDQEILTGLPKALTVIS